MAALRCGPPGAALRLLERRLLVFAKELPPLVVNAVVGHAIVDMHLACGIALYKIVTHAS
jgi:hypothetical protein